MDPFDTIPGKPGNTEDNGIVVLSRTQPMMCGGTDATQDTRAPKEIRSDKMLSFDVSSALPVGAFMPSAGGAFEIGMGAMGGVPGMGIRLGGGAAPAGTGTPGQPAAAQYAETFTRLSAFAAPISGGTFLQLQTVSGPYGQETVRTDRAVVREDLMPALVQLVREFDLARSNGFHSTTHGLPQNFGGSVDIRYEGGEQISFSNNQSALFSQEFAQRVASLFTQATEGARVELPRGADVRELRYREERKDGGYTKTDVFFAEDGSALCRRERRYDRPDIYKSEKTLDAETAGKIRKIIDNAMMFAWMDLPEQKTFSFLSDKSITFVLADGAERTVTNDRLLPVPISNAFFDIEMLLN